MLSVWKRVNRVLTILQGKGTAKSDFLMDLISGAGKTEAAKTAKPAAPAPSKAAPAKAEKK